MKILALETSTDIASLALLCDGEVRSIRLASPPAHSATLLPALRQLLAEAQLDLARLDVIACGIGPGAFTGVRLACSVAQGLALGTDLPVAPVCSLLALAQGQTADKVYCAMDARMNEAYVAAYQRENGRWLEVLAPACVTPTALPQPASDGWFGVGTAFSAYPLESAGSLAGKLCAEPLSAVPSAQAVAELAALTGPAGWCDAALLAPLYVRDRIALTVAERLAAGGKA
ncbi:tRNA (adenosine(37)-N6)-threonylcarbamoyltransferase complex dimerization subunit type 1 TsaB [Uliginosibacterium sp. 31-16]|uniref:tRNA (adenosine(37)-N6)-threonylcarbamoyltransferase complex dimerization subunit type 1 TsaB n=1 Tax=Uliginosibacterium sp. 31-16 TaxID=3068315 RepID=UPI00273F0223|nr:tRNA (adenosine(37)-N6)-threonylcarbamoyltransferase complex dimerization subunit type 1 TsaB [Uliginosibacterium sp. 31-16]MDP5239554.1 tRNA (adenosine(37)-N6)-threonylcarbamoyltransferase complex dimerization subunit type 1 TsaB [Uliginosibacterium sp. 31-16]